MLSGSVRSQFKADLIIDMLCSYKGMVSAIHIEKQHFRFSVAVSMISKIEITRTTRTPAFWGYPPPPHGYRYYWPVHIGSQVKTKQSQSQKFKEFVKTNFWILIKTLHATHVLKLLDKVCNHEIDPASIIEDTERTRNKEEEYGFQST